VKNVSAKLLRKRINTFTGAKMDITNCIKSITSTWFGHPGTTDQVLASIEAQTNLSLPGDFKEFMKWSNGGEAKFSNVYFSLWEAENIVSLNKDYQIQRYLGENVVGIGSDGGPICFLLDYRGDEELRFSSVNFGDLDPSEIKIIAPSFSDALTMAINGTLIDDNL